jgi:gliding motility-associated lipoprotein GldH
VRHSSERLRQSSEGVGQSSEGVRQSSEGVRHSSERVRQSSEGYKRNNNQSLKNFLSISLFFLAASCTLNADLGVYEKTVSFSNHSWNTNNRPAFDFVISDTASSYNIYVVLRHTDAYKYNNIWLNLTTSAPGDTAKSQQLNLKIGDNKKWFGSAMDDIIEYRVPITQNAVQLKPGKYTFILQHIMRQDELTEMLNAGIRVEKSSR